MRCGRLTSVACWLGPSVFAHQTLGTSASEEVSLQNVTPSTLDTSFMGIANLKIHAAGNDLVLTR